MPWVQTVHDLIPLTWNDPAMAAERRQWQRRASRLGRAQAVIAVSNYTATDIAQRLSIDAGRIHVAHHGVDPGLAPPAERRSPDQPFLLYVGEYGPWKGYPEAFALISQLAQRGYPHRLVVVGRLAPWVAPVVRRLVAACQHPERVELTGFIARPELIRAYHQATALVVTSRCEGFGLPALEAMACGTPVVAFANTATAEVVAEGGELVLDGDVSVMVEAVARVIEDPQQSQELSQRAVRRASNFSWRESAQRHIAAYREAAGA
jgi:glycosyltransferase involved in cell wall biosynthesis